MRISGQENGVGTVVGANVRLVGTLKDTNDIVVHGTVEGEVISSKSIQVTETAMVKGPVIGEIVTISGTVKGSIEAHEKLEILQSGVVTGSITSATLIIHAGASFNGKSAMVDAKSAGQKKDDKPTTDEAKPKETEKEPSSDGETDQKTKDDSGFEFE